MAYPGRRTIAVAAAQDDGAAWEVPEDCSALQPSLSRIVLPSWSNDQRQGILLQTTLGFCA
jgi:hypothetical protein